MIQVASRLHVLRPRIVERASHQLARGEGLRAVAAEQISRFYMLLEDAVESGSPEWLDPCLQDWVKARSTAAYGDTPLTFLPVLDVLKSTIWDVVQENCLAEEALGKPFSSCTRHKITCSASTNPRPISSPLPRTNSRHR